MGKAKKILYENSDSCKMIILFQKSKNDKNLNNYLNQKIRKNFHIIFRFRNNFSRLVFWSKNSISWWNDEQKNGWRNVRMTVINSLVERIFCHMLTFLAKSFWTHEKNFKPALIKWKHFDNEMRLNSFRMVFFLSLCFRNVFHYN